METFLTVKNKNEDIGIPNKSLSELRNANLHKEINVCDFIKYISKIIKNKNKINGDVIDLIEEIVKDFSFSIAIYGKFQQFLNLFFNCQ